VYGQPMRGRMYSCAQLSGPAGHHHGGRLVSAEHRVLSQGVGPDRHSSPRHRIPFDSRNEGQYDI